MPRRHRPLLQEAIDWRSYLVPGDARYVPDTVRPKMPDVVARALAAGATPPLEYMGAGMTGIVFCSGDVAYKVARDTRPIDHQFFEEEADWLAVAVRVPAVSPHVAHFLDFDPDNLVITRDCARADPDQSAWRYGENKLHDLHRQIERAMIPHGWTAPEFKPDSYVLTTSGPVLVDASMPSRVGEELARYVEAVVADERPLWTTRPQDLAFAVRMEAGRTLSQAESDRFEALILQRWPPDDGEVGELHQKNGLRDKRQISLREAQDASICIIFDDHGRVLTVSRPEPPHEQSIPGGIVDLGETPARAAVRELREECAIDLRELHHVTVVRSPTDGRRVHVFVASDYRGTAYAAEPNTRMEWLSPQQLLAQSRRYRSTLRELMSAGLLGEEFRTILNRAAYRRA